MAPSKSKTTMPAIRPSTTTTKSKSVPLPTKKRCLSLSLPPTSLFTFTGSNKRHKPSPSSSPANTIPRADLIPFLDLLQPYMNFQLSLAKLNEDQLFESQQRMTSVSNAVQRLQDWAVGKEVGPVPVHDGDVHVGVDAEGEEVVDEDEVDYGDGKLVVDEEVVQKKPAKKLPEKIVTKAKAVDLDSEEEDAEGLEAPRSKSGFFVNQETDEGVEEAFLRGSDDEGTIDVAGSEEEEEEEAEPPKPATKATPARPRKTYTEPVDPDDEEDEEGAGAGASEDDDDASDYEDAEGELDEVESDEEVSKPTSSVTIEKSAKREQDDRTVNTRGKAKIANK